MHSNSFKRIPLAEMSQEQPINGSKGIPESETEKPKGPAPLTIRKPSEIVAMEFPESDILLENGYLAKGDSLAICGAGGVGKSRLELQLVFSLVTGRDFLGWETRGKGTRWLILQTENSNRRLKRDLSAMFSDLTEEEKGAVDEGVFIHTLETPEDSFVSLTLPENEARIASKIQEINPTGVVYDVLRDYGIGDLNKDEGMTATLSAIGRITRQGDVQRIPIVSHHALTGKSGAAKATGFDRGSFGRNSKVLLGWARSQINLAPYEADNNDVLVVASGKANNAEEFEPFGIRLNPETMMYDRDDSVDLEAWRERVGADSNGATATIADVVKIVSRAGLKGIAKAKIRAALMAEVTVSKATAYRLIEKAEAKKAVARRKDDDLYVVPQPR